MAVMDGGFCDEDIVGGEEGDEGRDRDGDVERCTTYLLTVRETMIPLFLNVNFAVRMCEMRLVRTM